MEDRDVGRLDMAKTADQMKSVLAFGHDIAIAIVRTIDGDVLSGLSRGLQLVKISGHGLSRSNIFGFTGDRIIADVTHGRKPAMLIERDPFAIVIDGAVFGVAGKHFLDPLDYSRVSPSFRCFAVHDQRLLGVDLHDDVGAIRAFLRWQSKLGPSLGSEPDTLEPFTGAWPGLVYLAAG